MSEENEQPTEAESTERAPYRHQPMGPLNKASDMAIRPGFRNPANTRSKAQKNKKKR